MVILIVLTLFRGDGKGLSVVGISKCSAADFVMILLLLIFVVVYTLYSIFKILLPEYKEKKEAGYVFVDGDFECTAKNSIKMICIAFFGAFCGACVGIGTGSIFNPALIAMKMPPASGSASGMYLTIYTTCSAALVMLIFGVLDLHYCLILNIVVIIATFPGLYL
jgi:uncharacterized membrane protein YfcA